MEIGSAGEQPIRDKLDDRQKSQEKELVLSSFLTFLEVSYASKNPSINFFFLVIDNPL